MLRVYQEKTLNTPDVALQLPTGSGKTLVGLLIGEWRRRRFQEKVVYLCPTNQVVEQATKKYGIKALAFTGKASAYHPTSKAEYQNAETLAITTYNALFNTRPFFENPQLIIFDDAHASENYIASHWSLSVSKADFPRVFEALVVLLQPVLSRVDYQKLTNPTRELWDTEWVEKIPTSSLFPLISELTAVLDQQTANEQALKFTWSVLRENLFACHVYLSTTSILIRPTIPPTLTHSPFAKAKQRIYMSATLGAGGDLERLTGVEKIERLPIPLGWDKQGIGRRLFFFPESSLSGPDSITLACNMIKTTRRSLILVTSTTVVSNPAV